MDIKPDWTKPFLLEQKVADLISKQWKHGCNFDERQARWYVHVLTEKILKIDLELVPLLPPMQHKGTEYKAPFKMNGQPKVFVQKYMDTHGLTLDEVSGPFSAVWYTPFDPGKTSRLKDVMLDMGWLPTEWNEKKTPFQVWQYRKRLEKSTFANFINNQCDKEDKVAFLKAVEGFVDSHLRGKSKGYMRAILTAIGFDLSRKVPNFDQIKKKLLLRQFWPTSPKITEDSFESVSEDEGLALKLLKERMIWAHRRSLIQGLIEQVRVDGKLSGEANPCATPTARMRHKIIVNIPAAGSPFGEKCRHLFKGDKRKGSTAKLVRKLTAEMEASGKFRRKPLTNIMQEFDKGRWEDAGHCSFLIPAGQDAFVGGDGAGLELRMLTHYLIAVSKMLLEEAKESGDKKKEAYYQKALDSALEYREVLLNGDIHSHNQKLAGLPTRKQAKTFIYAFLYGAGNANLGAQLGGGLEEGQNAREAFLKECPCIPVLMDWVQDFAGKNGWVPAIDGRKLIMRRDPFSGEVMTHKALNTMLQSAGSIVMKIADCYLTGWIEKSGLEAYQVIMMHDEFQFTCKWEDVPTLRSYIDACVKKAGESLNMECPLASDSMLGGSWLHTH